MSTIEQVAKELGVSVQAAYGLMQFMKEINQVTITDAPTNGKRGRRPKLYQLTAIGEYHLQSLMNDAFPIKHIEQHLAALDAPLQAAG